MHKLQENGWKYVVFILYTLLLGIVIYHHEPWFDEAQAWLLARDTNPYDLLVKYMRYEGSPGLWQLLLMIPAKLNLPYFSLNILSGLIAAAGVFFFLRYSPFPAFIKLLFPFSFFAFYQYAVVARSYALLPLFLFLIAMVYRDKAQKPLIFVSLLCLLANVSLHGFLIASGLLFVHLIDLVKPWTSFDKTQKKKHLLSLVIYGITGILIVLELKPAPDLITFAAFNRDLSFFYSRSLHMLSDSMITNLSAPSPGHPLLNTAADMFFRFILVLSLFWLICRKKLLVFIIPLTGLGFVFTIIYVNVWHQGTMFFTWLFALWVSFDNCRGLPKWEHSARRMVIAALAVVLSVQVYWSYKSFTYDLSHNYSASREAASYIKEKQLSHKKIYVTSFHTISILPYFNDNIFCNFNHNQKPAFWLWSGRNRMYTEPYLHLEGYHPDLIILGIKNYCSTEDKTKADPVPAIPGYKLLKIFNGKLYWKDQTYETDSFAFYERSAG